MSAMENIPIHAVAGVACESTKATQWLGERASQQHPNLLATRTWRMVYTHMYRLDNMTSTREYEHIEADI